MTANDVLDALHPVLMKHGKSDFIHSDNGREFVALHYQYWLKGVGIQPMPIYPGSPWETGYNERFNRTLRREVLNAEWLHTNNLRSQSMPRSGNTTRSDLITHWV
jgi:putative transposase